MSAVERMLAMLAAPGTETCDVAAEGLTCQRPPHPCEVDDEQPHIAMIDGSPVQWITVSADQGQPNTGQAEHGSA